MTVTTQLFLKNVEITEMFINEKGEPGEVFSRFKGFLISMEEGCSYFLDGENFLDVIMYKDMILNKHNIKTSIEDSVFIQEVKMDKEFMSTIDITFNIENDFNKDKLSIVTVMIDGSTYLEKMIYDDEIIFDKEIVEPLLLDDNNSNKELFFIITNNEGISILSFNNKKDLEEYVSKDNNIERVRIIFLEPYDINELSMKIYDLYKDFFGNDTDFLLGLEEEMDIINIVFIKELSKFHFINIMSHISNDFTCLMMTNYTDEIFVEHNIFSSKDSPIAWLRKMKEMSLEEIEKYYKLYQLEEEQTQGIYLNFSKEKIRNDIIEKDDSKSISELLSIKSYYDKKEEDF
jgi:hypothetical protein